MKHLIIPDAHATPGEDLRRFEWLGEMIMKEQPEVIVDIGDWYDMPSLCTYDEGLMKAEGRRYVDDIEVGREAERLAFGPIIDYNNKMSRWKKKKYDPIIIRTLGNHETPRLEKFIQKNSKLEGTMTTKDFISPLSDKLDIRTYPFLQPVIQDDIAYSHYFTSGVMGRPITGAHLMVRRKLISCTMGHSHTRDWAEEIKVDGTRMQGLICGSFHDPEHKSSYADEQSQGFWWSGLHIKHDVKDGDYDLESINVNRLQRMMEGN